jgi:hypothetical protein
MFVHKFLVIFQIGWFAGDQQQQLNSQPDVGTYQPKYGLTGG